MCRSRAGKLLIYPTDGLLPSFHSCAWTRGVATSLGQLTFILLLGPILEERYGTGEITFMIFATALATGFANILLSPNHLVGASGVVFMLIILASIVDFRKGTILLAFF